MFKTAILRKPGPNFATGITTASIGKPDFIKTLLQHSKYTETLIDAGANIRMLKSIEKYPDGTFVEDAAVVTSQFAVITQPGAEPRRGETVDVEHVLGDFLPIERITGDATIDGGDVIQAEKLFFVGISGRTNQEGAQQFAAIVEKFGYKTTFVEVNDMLHLKSGVNYIGNNRMVMLSEFAQHPAFSSFERIQVTKKESYAANCLLFNDKLLIPSGFPKITEKLSKLNYNIVEIDMSEFQKMDGGLSCLSLRF